MENAGKAADAIEEFDVEYQQDDSAIHIVAEEDLRSQLVRQLVEEGIGVKSVQLEEETLETTYLNLTGGG